MWLSLFISFFYLDWLILKNQIWRPTILWYTPSKLVRRFSYAFRPAVRGRFNDNRYRYITECRETQEQIAIYISGWHSVGLNEDRGDETAGVFDILLLEG